MSDRSEGLPDLLDRVRRLQAARDHAGVREALAGVPPSDLLAEPALGYALAVALRALGEPREALGLVTELREPCARRGRDRLYRQRLNLEAALEFERGGLQRAETLWQELLSLATAAGDHDLVAKASNNLGILHTLGGRSLEALSSYSRALLASQRLGDRRGLAQAHQNLAITFREAGFAYEADAHFHEAVVHARSVDGDDVLGRAEEERAILFLLKGDPKMAAASATRALGRLSKIGDAAGEAEALRVLGLVALCQDRPDEARDRLSEALERSRAMGHPLLEAETLQALAGLERSRGRDGAAAELAETAGRLFREIGAEPWGEQSRRRIEELLGSIA